MIAIIIVAFFMVGCGIGLLASGIFMEKNDIWKRPPRELHKAERIPGTDLFKTVVEIREEK